VAVDSARRRWEIVIAFDVARAQATLDIVDATGCDRGAEHLR
jgi:hypothetical protein